jgi:recombinational DNA repair protein RecR
MSEKEDQLQEYQQQEREKKVEQKQELDLDYKRMNYCDVCGKHTFWQNKEHCSVCSDKPK